MSRWLLKTEPGTYSFADLLRDKQTVWEGITNPTALIHIRNMKKGDAVFVYHSGKERAAVGTATIASNPYPDPKAKNEKIVVVDLKAGKALPRAVTLDEIKSDPAFAGWDLLRISRLSVVPVSDAIWKRIETLSRQQTSQQGSKS